MSAFLKVRAQSCHFVTVLEHLWFLLDTPRHWKRWLWLGRWKNERSLSRTSRQKGSAGWENKAARLLVAMERATKNEYKRAHMNDHISDAAAVRVWCEGE